MIGGAALGIAVAGWAAPAPVPVPGSWGLDPWYRRGLEVEGIRIAGSGRSGDLALQEAGRMVRVLLRPIPAVRDELVRQRIHVAVMAESEVTTDVPEHADLPRRHPGTDWNARARGLGPVQGMMLVSTAEENLVRRPDDRYRGESIFIHEFAHAVMDFGLVRTDPTFLPRLRDAYDEALRKGRWRGTYAATNLQEYWAEGVQSHFAANAPGVPGTSPDRPDGVHNGVDTPEELAAHDPPLAVLIRSVFGPPGYRWDRTKR